LNGVVIPQPFANSILRGKMKKIDQSDLPVTMGREIYILNGGYAHGTMVIDKISIDNVHGFTWFLKNVKRIVPKKVKSKEKKWSRWIERVELV